MYKTLQPVLQKELAAIKEAGLFKKERIITTPQGAPLIHMGTECRLFDSFAERRIFIKNWKKRFPNF